MRGAARWGRRSVPFVFFAALLFAQVEEDWASSPEAYFLTSEERTEWRKLGSRESRHDFIERYWLKRDPTPGTGANEFHDLILSRIKTADARFKIEKTPGSRTAQGLVFIVLGSPARVQDELTPKPLPDSPRRAFTGVTPVATFEGNERTSTWSYDPDRTPRILEVIKRTSLQIKIVIEPSVHKDSIQNPGLFNDIRETVARASIVNPDLVTAREPAETAAPRAPALSRGTLSAAARPVLEAGAASPRSEDGFVGSAVLFRDKGEAESLIWVFTSKPPKKPQLHLLVRGDDGGEVVAVSEPAEVSNAFSSRSPGMVALRRLELPPGSYSAAVALGEENGKPAAAANVPLQVPAVGKVFAVSSLIITRGPAAAGPSSASTFTFAGTALPPRADATFGSSESLWYFLEVANPSDASKVMLEPRLRRGTEQFLGLNPFPAILQPLGGGRYMAGIEVPLATLAPGDYVLYVSVTDGDAPGRPSTLKRADFRLVP